MAEHYEDSRSYAIGLNNQRAKPQVKPARAVW